ncbi:hypothetical protein LK12_19995 [Novosphingobium malaysiense]|uniref:Sulfotransferase domain-containing protein n=2 Tax=Novosphingobium malaysiense TaxID=1348853 RepID=A0A0B1ZED2_9SPHN|nr:hypothetical protein LK12_19995 [Novosphingobium malaysiense]
MHRVGPALADQGVYYPPAVLGHRDFAERAYIDDYEWVDRVMADARARDATTLLISTEHFQNVLCQKVYGLGIGLAFREREAEEVRYVFSVRDPFDYFESIYAEAAKWFPISVEQAANAALRQGSFWTAWQALVPVAYVFDYATVFGEFRNYLATVDPAITLDCWELSDFSHGFAGRRLLETAGVSDGVLKEIEAGLESGEITINRNQRSSAQDIEIFHAQQYLFGNTVLPSLAAQKSDQLEPVANLVAQVAETKLRQINSQRDALRARFAERFANWRECLSQD